MREQLFFFSSWLGGLGVYFEQSGRQRVVTATAPTVSLQGADCDSLWQWLSLSTLKQPLVRGHQNAFSLAMCSLWSPICLI